MKNGFKIFDSDLHVMEPPDLWPQYIDSAFSNSNFDFAKGSWLSIDTDFAKVEISRAPRRQR